jgi:hypothetical protein
MFRFLPFFSVVVVDGQGKMVRVVWLDDMDHVNFAWACRVLDRAPHIIPLGLFHALLRFTWMEAEGEGNPRSFVFVFLEKLFTEFMDYHDDIVQDIL